MIIQLDTHGTTVRVTPNILSRRSQAGSPIGYFENRVRRKVKAAMREKLRGLK